MVKAIAHPTDSALLERSRILLVKAARQYGLALRQNYGRLAPRLACQVAHPALARKFKHMRRALQALRSRLGRVSATPSANYSARHELRANGLMYFQSR